MCNRDNCRFYALYDQRKVNGLYQISYIEPVSDVAGKNEKHSRSNSRLSDTSDYDDEFEY